MVPNIWIISTQHTKVPCPARARCSNM